MNNCTLRFTAHLSVIVFFIFVSACGGSTNPQEPPLESPPQEDAVFPDSVSETGLGVVLTTSDTIKVPDELVGKWSRVLTHNDESCTEVLNLTARNTYYIKSANSELRGRYLLKIGAGNQRYSWIVYGHAPHSGSDCFGSTDIDTSNRGLYLSLNTNTEPHRLSVFRLNIGGTPLAVYSKGLPGPSTQPPQQTLSNFESLALMREESGLSKDVALAQFVAHFGAVEGVEGIDYDGSMPMFASQALADILSFDDELDEAVLARIYQRILPTDTESGDGTARVLTSHSRVADVGLTTLAKEIAVDIGGRMSRSLQSDLELIRVTSSTELNADETAEPRIFTIAPATRLALVNDRGLVLSDVGLNSIDSCWIVINEGTGSQSFDSFSNQIQRMALVHEVMRCFQHELTSVTNVAGWILEGSAAWAGEEYVGGTGYYNSPVWESYEKPLYDLFRTNSLTAIGFWSHVSNSISSSLWELLPIIYESSVTDSFTNLASLVDQLGTDGYANWPTGGMMRPDWGPEWESLGVGGRNVAKQPEAIGMEDSSIETRFSETKLLRLETSVSEPAILTVISDGVGLMHWSESGSSIAFGGEEALQFCLSGDCLCGDGSAPGGFEGLEIAPLGEDLIVAMTGKANRRESTFSTELTNISDVCSDVAEPTARQCLIGKWSLDLDFMRNQFIQIQGADFDPGTFAGTVTIDLADDGSGEGFADFSLTAPVQDGFSSITRGEGTSTFDWSVSGSTYSVTNPGGDGISITATLFFNGLEIDEVDTGLTADQLFGASEEDTVEYSCEGDEFLITRTQDDDFQVRYTRVE